MENFDEYFKNLDTINQVEREIKCCETKDNYDYSDKNGITCKVCHNCISNIIDTPEWKNYKDSNVNMTRCGMPTNIMLPQSSLGTTIKYDFKSNMTRVNRYQQWNSMPYKERSLYKVFMDISEKCATADLPKVISETAQSYYRNVSETKISRGSNRIGIIAACIYYACKECKVPRSTAELASLFDIDSKIMTKGCKKFTEITRLSINRNSQNRIQSQKSINLHDFIERFCHKLNIDSSHQIKIKQLSELCEKMDLINDNTPPAMASGCIYLYLRHKKIEMDKKTISDVCKISEVTINKCSKKIEIIKEIQEFLK
jgi:transcription initiation factor TFIIB